MVALQTSQTVPGTVFTWGCIDHRASYWEEHLCWWQPIFDPFAHLPIRVCLPGFDWRSVLAIPLVGLGNRILLPHGKGLFALC